MLWIGGLVNQIRLTIGICVGVVAIAFENIAVTTAMPKAAVDLGGLGSYGWVFSLFVIGSLIGTVTAGASADVSGPVRPLVIGFVVFSFGLVVAAVSPSWLVLLAARSIQGLGSGYMYVGVIVLISYAYEPQARARVLTYISAAWVLPAFVGPIAAAWLTTTLNWHWVFWSVLPIVGFAAIASAPELLKGFEVPDGQRPKPIPLWAAASAGVGCSAVQLSGTLSGIAFVVAWGAALVSLVASSIWILPSGNPTRGLAPVMLSRGFASGAVFAGQSLYPLFLTERYGFPTMWAGGVLTIGTVGWLGGSWLQSQTWFTLRRDLIIVLGCVLAAVGVGIVALPAWFPGIWLGTVVFGWSIAGVGMGLCVPSGTLAVLQLSAATTQGRNTSSLIVFESVGNAAWMGVAGSVLAASRASDMLDAGYRGVFTICAGAALAAAALALRIGPVRLDSK